MTVKLPPSDLATPLLRTDYSDERAWQALLQHISVPSPEGFLATITVVEDPDLDGMSEAEIRVMPAEGERPLLTLVADATAQRGDDHPILVVDTFAEGQPSFRVAARCLWAVQNNLSLANMDWEDFSDAVDADGVYRDC